MAELDLSLSDALTDSAPQLGQENQVERDFVAQLEAETFDDQVKETVGKTDFIPLLDNDDVRADTSAGLENGEQEAGVQKPGVSQPGDIGKNMEVGASPLQAEKPPSIAKPQHPTFPADVPKESSPMPEPSYSSLSPGLLDDSWTDQTGVLSTAAPFPPSVSVVFDKQTDNHAASPEEPPDSWPGGESAVCGGGDDKDGDASDRKQKKKKKRRQKDEGSYEHESSGQQEPQTGDNSPLAEEYYHRIGPRRDRGDGGWEEHLGKGGARGKRGKNRKKLPEEWAVSAEPFVPSSVTTTVMDVESSTQANVEVSFVDTSAPQTLWNKADSDEGLGPLSQIHEDVSPVAANINPLVLNSELKATAAPFTMPSSATKAGVPPVDDPFDLLMDSENASLGHNSQAFSPPFSPEDKAGDVMDSGIFDNSTSFPNFSVQGMPDIDTSAFSSDSHTSLGLSPQGELLASAPPLSPSDASWLLNSSHRSSNSDLLDLSHPLPLGLTFDTPSPAPLRSPKTTAQEQQSKEQKGVKLSQKKSVSSAKSPTTPEATSCSPQASPIPTPSSPPSGLPGSGLNPAAKPFFPSFVDPVDEPAVTPPVAPTMEVKPEKMEMEEEKAEKNGDVKKVEPSDQVDAAEQKKDKVEVVTSETPAKMEKEEKVEQVKEEKQLDKHTEKEAERVDEKKETASVKENETEKVEAVQEKQEKAEEAAVKVDEVEKTPQKPEEVDREKKTEEKALENKAEVENHTTEKEQKTEEKELKREEKEHREEYIELPSKADDVSDKTEKMDVTETKMTTEIEDTKKEKTDTEATEKEAPASEPSEKPEVKVPQTEEKKEKQEKIPAEKKEEKKPVKSEGEKNKKPSKPAAGGSSAAHSKDSADKKTKPTAGLTKPGTASKTRPNSAAAGVSLTASKRPTPPLTTSTSDKKTAAPKTTSSTLAGPKRPAVSSISRPSSSTTSRDLKSKPPQPTTEKRPPVAKPSTATSSKNGPSAATKNGTTAASRTTTTARTAASTRTTPSATAAKKPLGSKAAESKPGDEKKPGSLKTSTADSAKPKTTTTTTRTAASTSAAAPRTRPPAAKPPAPSSTTGAAQEKKPPVPRAPRAPASTTTAAASKPAARPGSATAPDVRNARSKIGSTDNMKHQPGGGKVSSVSQSRTATSKETNLSKVQILNKKVDVSKVTSKCGSKDNIKHKPGGGAVKIESRKVNFREKAQSKVGSMDNVSQSAGDDVKEVTEGSGAAQGASPDSAPEPGQAGSPPTHENGLKEGASGHGEGLQEPQVLDSLIPETSI
ncbi:microtubule-associated protein 4 isoform X4 [Oryzias melastigma]|uniref:Microtubule-associated protein n=1 Tax=Oryzias melastigma TaxID=30732 RepID=A0A3B3B5F4_ORYME|nr:microtubule-associated protein 4 isoform X4 [Oryzias melastigma]